MTSTVYRGDCLNVLPIIASDSVDAIITDPPYELAFMGKKWDGNGIAFDVNMWRECLRVLKPGGHLLSFGGTRTWHRLCCAIEDSGFEIRDSIAWLYGSGFPKSLDVSKAIDKTAGEGLRSITAPSTDAAKQWQGYGTALKPAFEPIVVARKPIQGTVAANVLAHGTGALNIDACRVATSTADAKAMERANTPGSGRMKSGGSPIGTFVRSNATGAMDTTTGRWPTNVVIDEYTAQGIDQDSGVSPSNFRNSKGRKGSGTGYGESSIWKEQDHGRDTSGVRPRDGFGLRGRSAADPGTGDTRTPDEDDPTAQPLVSGGHNDSGGASRFFPTFKYQAKAPKTERPNVGGVSHPTVKPLALLQWLVTLTTPRGGIVLDPFAGSGTVCEAALLNGMRCIGIESESDYIPLIIKRLRRTGAKVNSPKWIEVPCVTE